MKTLLKIVAVSFVIFGLSACSDPKPVAAVAPTPPDRPAETAPAGPASAASRGQDFATVMKGATVYQANCAACHGPQGEGAPNWQRRGPDGKMPPPPLNGSGHAWHHPQAWIRDQIMKGSLNRGGAMPGWEGKLSDAEIEAVIAWIQSRWPDEIYDSWLAMDQKARQAGAAR